MGISRKRRLETLETQLPTSEDRVSQEVVYRAARRLRQESPKALELVQGIILRHERLGAPVDDDGHHIVEVTDEERLTYGWLHEFIAEEAHREGQ